MNIFTFPNLLQICHFFPYNYALKRWSFLMNVPEDTCLYFSPWTTPSKLKWYVHCACILMNKMCLCLPLSVYLTEWLLFIVAWNIFAHFWWFAIFRFKKKKKLFRLLKDLAEQSRSVGRCLFTQIGGMHWDNIVEIIYSRHKYSRALANSSSQFLIHNIKATFIFVLLFLVVFAFKFLNGVCTNAHLSHPMPLCLCFIQLSSFIHSST